VPCPFIGEVFTFVVAAHDDDDEGFSGGGGTYFRIAEFIGFKLTFVITDAT